jgi:hypothetical protein
MSLITLTFGYGNERFDYLNKSFYHAKVKSPISNLKGKNGTLKIKKITKFFNVPEVFVVGEVTEGLIADTMKGCINGCEFEVASVESKFGPVGKKGATIGAYLKGIEEKENLEIGQELKIGK